MSTTRREKGRQIARASYQAAIDEGHDAATALTRAYNAGRPYGLSTQDAADAATRISDPQAEAHRAAYQAYATARYNGAPEAEAYAEAELNALAAAGTPQARANARAAARAAARQYNAESNALGDQPL